MCIQAEGQALAMQFHAASAVSVLLASSMQEAQLNALRVLAAWSRGRTFTLVVGTSYTHCCSTNSGEMCPDGNHWDLAPHLTHRFIFIP